MAGAGDSGRNVELEGLFRKTVDKGNTNTALQLEPSPWSDCECVFESAAFDVNARHNLSVLIIVHLHLSVRSVVHILVG